MVPIQCHWVPLGAILVPIEFSLGSILFSIGGHIGFHWVPFWFPLGAILDPIGSHWDSHRAPSWIPSGAILVPIGIPIGRHLGSHRAPYWFPLGFPLGFPFRPHSGSHFGVPPLQRSPKAPPPRLDPITLTPLCPTGVGRHHGGPPQRRRDPRWLPGGGLCGGVQLRRRFGVGQR